MADDSSELLTTTVRRRRKDPAAPAEPVASAAAPDPEAVSADPVACLKSTMAIDVLILMDCTGSMGSWIAAAKATAIATATNVRHEFPGAPFRLGFVGYRDHCDGPASFVNIPFTADVGQVQTALGSVSASGGGDIPEDVVGGLKRALEAPWVKGTNIVVHVADAPCHGKKFHSVGDSLPDGDPSGVDPCSQIAELARQGKDYYFIKCHPCTDTMIRLFNEAYEGARAGEEQVFMVIDLQKQGAASTAGVSESLAGLRVTDLPSASAAPPVRRSAVAGVGAPAAAAGSSALDDAFGDAITASVKRSVKSRSKPA